MGGGDFFFSSIRAMVMQKILRGGCSKSASKFGFWILWVFAGEKIFGLSRRSGLLLFLNFGSYKVFQGKFFSLAACTHYL